jgi:hypothetical protein
MKSSIVGRGLGFIVAGAFGLLSSAAMAGESVALILDYASKPDSRFQAYNELPDETTLELGASGRITLLHYKTCRTVAIQGGNVRVTTADLAVEGGSQNVVDYFSCPQESRIKIAGVSGGVLIRDVGGPSLPPSLSCILVGHKAMEVESLALTKGGRKIAALSVKGLRTTPAPSARAIEPGRDYTLLIKLKGEAAQHQQPISIAKSAQPGPCLLRVD